MENLYEKEARQDEQSSKLADRGETDNEQNREKTQLYEGEP